MTAELTVTCSYNCILALVAFGIGFVLLGFFIYSTVVYCGEKFCTRKESEPTDNVDESIAGFNNGESSVAVNPPEGEVQFNSQEV